ncbi:hypothetical protein C8R43DRAFT_881611 [Mycena crocata]|nr:hypothetical protein C8R43DRAFT_881611 [Mycena crocata]
MPSTPATGTFSTQDAPLPPPPPTNSSSTQDAPPLTNSSSTDAPLPLPPVSRAALQILPLPLPLTQAPSAPAGLQVVVPENAPNWLREVVHWLLERDLGCHFTALVAALVQLETAFKFDDGNEARLPVGSRPTPVTNWISRGRVSKTQKIPQVANVAKYAEQFMLWWDELQPEWRKRKKDGGWEFGGDVAYGKPDEWGELDVPGQNGCLSVVAGLYIWGTCDNQSADVTARWELAVLDVTWMLEGLTQSMTPG